ncbi:TPA: hypothetical protein N0F65_012626, partial [Lagenidium giganteum]
KRAGRPISISTQPFLCGDPAAIKSPKHQAKPSQATTRPRARAKRGRKVAAMGVISKLSLPQDMATVGSWSLGLFLTLQAVYHRDTVAIVLRDASKRLLFWRSMRRRFENRRVDKLQVVTDARRSQWMWTKGNTFDDEEDEDEPSGETDGLMTSQKKLVLVMVGLPARGKSFVVHKTTRYIEWLGFPTKIFNVGNYRRKIGKAGEDAKFFSADNEDATRLREEMAMDVLGELLEWLDTKGHVAVFDATNTTKLRRERILDKVRSHKNVRVMFVESICDNQELLEANYRRKLSNDDYANRDPEQALKDFRQRVAEYEKVYQTVEDNEDEGNACYVKVYNAGEKIQARFCQGFLQSHIVSLLQNIHLFPRRIWLVRPGASVTSCRGILGLDSDLAPEGHRVARAIGDFVNKQHLDRPMEVWTSVMKRSRQTACYLPTRCMKRFVTTTLLNELGGGDFEGLTPDEIRQYYPKHYAARQQDKLTYRYPGVGGESYVDLISRLRSLIVEFERKKRDVLVICNESVLRCLLGYFSGVEAAKVPHLDAQENIVFELSPHRDGCDIQRIPLEIPDEDHCCLACPTTQRSIPVQMQAEEKIRVAVRVRPLPRGSDGSTEVVTASPDADQVVVYTDATHHHAATFQCDTFLGPSITQEEVFSAIQAPELVEAALDGYPVTVFAYGQTGAGKSFTIFGKEEQGGNGKRQVTTGDGVLPRVAGHLIDVVHSRRHEIEYRIRVTCVEIYNEQVRDLFDPKKESLPVRHSKEHGFFLDNATVVQCTTAPELIAIVKVAAANRVRSSHLLNEQSNRSHCLVTIYIDSLPLDMSTGAVKKYGKLTIVDLAGSERVNDTGAVGAQLRETGHINKSLYCLSKVIQAMNSKAKAKFVPFRDSKLTMVLIHDGKLSKTLMLACVNSAAQFATESIRTLEFAMGVAKIKNRPTTLLNPHEKLINDLKEQIRLLKIENMLLRSRTPGCACFGRYVTGISNTTDMVMYVLALDFEEHPDRLIVEDLDNATIKELSAQMQKALLTERRSQQQQHASLPSSYTRVISTPLLHPISKTIEPREEKKKTLKNSSKLIKPQSRDRDNQAALPPVPTTVKQAQIQQSWASTTSNLRSQPVRPASPPPEYDDLFGVEMLPITAAVPPPQLKKSVSSGKLVLEPLPQSPPDRQSEQQLRELLDRLHGKSTRELPNRPPSDRPTFNFDFFGASSAEPTSRTTVPQPPAHHTSGVMSRNTLSPSMLASDEQRTQHLFQQLSGLLISNFELRLTMSHQPAADCDLVDGFSAQQIFHNGEGNGLTFDDIIALVRAPVALALVALLDFGCEAVDTTSRLTKKITLRMPIVSSPMDTVTEADMAIAIALQGGMGILHQNNTIEQQADMVRTVKQFENGFIVSPSVLSPDHTVEDLDKLKVSGVPITADGKPNGKLVGLVTSRDVDFVEDRTLKLRDVMVPRERVVVGQYPCTLEQANKTLKEAKKGTLPIVNDHDQLVSLVTRQDLVKNRDYPNALKSAETMKLLVGAAVSVNAQAKTRIAALVEAGADVIVLDARQGDSEEQIELVKYIKQTHPAVEVIGGNIVTMKQLRNLLEAGVDSVRVGMGVASISTSQEVKAVGRAQLSAIYNTALVAKEYDVPVIADGGIGNSGAAIKAMALGASCFMMGSALAGTAEAPGDYFFQDGIRLKRYYGSGSHEYYRTAPDDAANMVAFGVAGAVVDQGTVHQYVPYLQQSIRHGFQDLGVRSIPQLHAELYSGKVRFERRSICAQKEGGIHGLFSFTKQLEKAQMTATPSASATTSTTQTEPVAPLFWCHECTANVPTAVDAASDEVCCQQCGGNFVEEIEQASKLWLLDGAIAPGASRGRNATRRWEDDLPQVFHGAAAQPSNGIGNSNDSGERPQAQAPASASVASVEFSMARLSLMRMSLWHPYRLIQQLLAGGPGRSARVLGSRGNPVEIFVGDYAMPSDGLWSAIGGSLGLPMGGLASDAGDYAFGNLSTIINQLMQNDANRNADVAIASSAQHGAPPAAKEVLDKLPKIKISQSQVDANAECAVCKDLFSVDDDAHELPCSHEFHPDCILPWLKEVCFDVCLRLPVMISDVSCHRHSTILVQFVVMNYPQMMLNMSGGAVCKHRNSKSPSPLRLAMIALASEFRPIVGTITATEVTTALLAVIDHEKRLVYACEKYETLLAVARSHHPDFHALDAKQLIFGQAGKLLKRLALHHELHNGLGRHPKDPAARVDEIKAWVEKTRSLYQARELHRPSELDPEVNKLKQATQGEALCLVELAELQSTIGDTKEAIAIFGDAIRLCYSVADEATEGLITCKLQELQTHLDAAAALNAQLEEEEDNQEKQILLQAFARRAVGDTLTKGQLAELAVDLGSQEPLTEAEVEEIWTQIAEHAQGKEEPFDTIMFQDLWRWWLTETMFDYVHAHRRAARK